MPARILDAAQTDRNVVLRDYHGGVIAGFHQYGSVSWATLFRWLAALFATSEHWIIVNGDRYAVQEYLPSSSIVMSGKYTLLAADYSPLLVQLTPACARRRQSTPPRVRHPSPNLARVADRDGKCMVFGQLLTWNKLQASHIFPRCHQTEWQSMGYSDLITENSATQAMGGISKIDSLQNLLLLSADLHVSWADHDFGVDPDDDYRITAFVSGLDGIVGHELHLDHIRDPSTRPLDQLFRDHFHQCLLKHVKGVGETQWDYAQTFGLGAFDLSDDGVWGTEEGKERLELELENRLFEHRLGQEIQSGGLAAHDEGVVPLRV